jgi:hypothetical protein
MTHRFHSTSSGALPLLLASLLASAAQAEHKVQGPLPNMQDVKTPAPVLVEKPASAAPTTTETATTPARRQSAVKLPAGAESGARIDHERLYFDQVDGTVWVRGRDWKASFDGAGSTLIPIFGADAPRNYPIAFHVLGAQRGAAPLALGEPAITRASDTRVELDRGALVEGYEMTPGTVEQTFRFAALPATPSDLVVRVGFETELSPSHAADGGIDFANEFGRVHYSAAKVLDAAGHVQAIDTVLEDGVLEFTVPQSFLASATFPVTIDPVTSVFGVNTGPKTNYLPDVAYDAGSGRFLVVYEEDVSGFDHDVYATVLNTSGGVITSFYIDQTTDLWSRPSVACNALAGQFLVACERWNFSPWTIRGRMVTAASATPAGSTFLINEGTYDCRTPVVGGDPVLAGPTYFLVVYQRVFSNTDWDIHARLITSTGATQGTTIYIDNSSATLDSLPAISKSDGIEPYATQNWNVTWLREYSPTDHDLYGAQVLWDGTLTSPTFLIDFSSANDVDIAVSSPLDAASGTRPYMLAIQRQNGSQYDLLCSVFNGTTYVASADLQQIEGLGLGSQDQINPSVDSDGRKFMVCYSEQYQGSSTDYDTWIASLELVGPALVLSEAHGQLGYTTNGERETAVVARHSGGGPSASGTIAVWSEYVYSGASLVGLDIRAGLYASIPFANFCIPGQNAIACPCGNGPGLAGAGCDNSAGTGGAFQYGSGSPANDTVVMTASGMLPSALAIFLQGASLSGSGVAFGDGVRCIGTLIRLGVKSSVSGSASYPEAGDQSMIARSATLGQPIVPGSPRYYQTYYRDPAATFACTGASTFNITNGVVVDW